jgi:hypothetical protein
MTLTQREIDAAFSRLPDPTEDGADVFKIEMMRPDSERVVTLTFIKEPSGRFAYRWALYI